MQDVEIIQHIKITHLDGCVCLGAILINVIVLDYSTQGVRSPPQSNTVCQKKVT